MGENKKNPNEGGNNFDAFIDETRDELTSQLKAAGIDSLESYPNEEELLEKEEKSELIKNITGTLSGQLQDVLKGQNIDNVYSLLNYTAELIKSGLEVDIFPLFLDLQNSEDIKFTDEDNLTRFLSFLKTILPLCQKNGNFSMENVSEKLTILIQHLCKKKSSDPSKKIRLLKFANKINDLGYKIDLTVIQNSINESLISACKSITKNNNPTLVTQYMKLLSPLELQGYKIPYFIFDKNGQPKEVSGAEFLKNYIEHNDALKALKERELKPLEKADKVKMMAELGLIENTNNSEELNRRATEDLREDLKNFVCFIACEMDNKIDKIKKMDKKNPNLSIISRIARKYNLDIDSTGNQLFFVETSLAKKENTEKSTVKLKKNKESIQEYSMLMIDVIFEKYLKISAAFSHLDDIIKEGQKEIRENKTKNSDNYTPEEIKMAKNIRKCREVVGRKWVEELKKKWEATKPNSGNLTSNESNALVNIKRQLSQQKNNSLIDGTEITAFDVELIVAEIIDSLDVFSSSHGNQKGQNISLTSDFDDITRNEIKYGPRADLLIYLRRFNFAFALDVTVASGKLDFKKKTKKTFGMNPTFLRHAPKYLERRVANAALSYNKAFAYKNPILNFSLFVDINKIQEIYELMLRNVIHKGQERGRSLSNIEDWDLTLEDMSLTNIVDVSDIFDQLNVQVQYFKKEVMRWSEYEKLYLSNKKRWRKDMMASDLLNFEFILKSAIKNAKKKNVHLNPNLDLIGMLKDKGLEIKDIIKQKWKDIKKAA